MNNNIRGIDLHDSLRLINPKPVDVWSGPYESVEEANVSIPKSIRYLSMIVRIINGDGTFLYWYKDGIENENLVRYLLEDFQKVNEDITRVNNRFSEIDETSILTSLRNFNTRIEDVESEESTRNQQELIREINTTNALIDIELATTNAINATEALSNKRISLEIKEDMKLYLKTPDNYDGLSFEIRNGNLIAKI